MILKQTLGAVALLCAMGASGGTASADVLFNNFGPANSYQTTSGVGFGGSNPSFEQAMGFTANGTYLLTGGDFGVSLSFGQNAPFQIRVHADVGGLPGAVLEQVTVTTQLGPFGLQNPPVVVQFAGTTVLNAGMQYWISMSAPATSSPVWNHNNIGDLGPRAFQVNGGGWNLFSNTDTRGAFRLQGTLVPAPGAIGLLGLFACAPRRRRKVCGGSEP